MGTEQGQHRLSVCPACAEGLKEVGGFLKFKKGGEKAKKELCISVTIILRETGSLFKLCQ